MIKEFRFENVPETNAHYSPAIICDNTVYISGQLPIDPVTREKCSGDIKVQAAQVFQNIEDILKQVGAEKSRIVKTTAYIPDMSLWNDLNEAYIKFFGNYKPARAIIAVSQIHFDFLVEIEAVALLNE
jgi:2-iminobutanoate/2-iminopropanoate deaminase